MQMRRVLSLKRKAEKVQQHKRSGNDFFRYGNIRFVDSMILFVRISIYSILFEYNNNKIKENFRSK
jgi:hypothetical protein